VEDRATPTLYLELVNLERAQYLEVRAREVLQHPGVERLTCWENLVPDRADLPRRLDEFGWLAVYEAGSEFAPPPPVPEARALHFRRTERPGQGRLSESETLGLLLVLISPHDRADATALRAWADFVHIRHIAETAVPGYTMITPYESADGGEPRFMHFYEMETTDAETSFQTMTPMVAERLGGFDGTAFRSWAVHDTLCIEYVSTFHRIGAAIVGRSSAGS
jgi:hypothetical protein